MASNNIACDMQAALQLCMRGDNADGVMFLAPVTPMMVLSLKDA
jgi:hypothetical protein